MSDAKPEKKAASSYKGTLNYEALRRDNTNHLRRINNIFIESELAVKGLRFVLEDVLRRKRNNEQRVSIVAPNSKGKNTEIHRKIDDVAALIKERIETKEYVQALVFAVSLTEDYISKVLVRTIRAYPPKILISAKGTELRDEQSLMVDMRDIMKLGSIGDLIFEKADQRVRDAMYASPKQYFDYLTAVLGFSLPEAVWQGFVEIKATRDLYVHGDGRANKIYLKKAASTARAKLGEKLPVDSAYLNSSMTCMKRVFTECYKPLHSRLSRSSGRLRSS